MKKWALATAGFVVVLGVGFFLASQKKAAAASPALADSTTAFSLNTDAAQRYRKVQPKHWRAAMVKGFGHNAMR